MKSYLSITSKYLKVQKKRTILSIIGIILSMALITGVGTIIISVRDALILEATKDNGDYHIEFSNIDYEKAEIIKNHVEVKETGVISQEGYAIVSKVSEEEKKAWGDVPNYRTLHIEKYDENALKMMDVEIKEGRLPKNENEIVLDEWVLGILNPDLYVGDKITLDISKKSIDELGESDELGELTKKEYTVVGVVKPQYYVSNRFYANGITFQEDTVLNEDSYFFVKLKNVKDAKEKGLNIANDAKISVENVEFNERVLRLYAESLNETLNSGMMNVVIFILFIIVICTIAVIYNTFNISVMERITQFGIIRCTGASPRQIRNIVFKEALTLSLIGLPIGAVSGVLAMKAVFWIVGLMKGSLSKFIFEGIRTTISPLMLILCFLIGLFTVLISAYGPARKAGKVSPIEAIRNSSSYKTEKKIKNRKTFLSKILFGFEGDMAAKNLKRNKKRFYITIFSMIISITMYIVFGSMVDYIYDIGADDNTLYAELGAGFGLIGSDRISQNIIDEISNIKDVEIVFPEKKDDVVLAVPEKKVGEKYNELIGSAIGQTIEDETFGRCSVMYNNVLLSYGNEGLKEIYNSFGSGKIDINEINKNNGVVLIQTGALYDSENRKRVYTDVTKYKVGDTIKLKLFQGEEFDIEVKVCGILDKNLGNDMKNKNGGITIFTTDEIFKKITGKDSTYSVFVKLNDGATKNTLIEYLDNLTNRDIRYSYIDVEDAISQMQNDVNVMRIFIFGFIAVIALIGCLNIINTISTSLILRTREISILKAIGMTQNEVKKMISLESVLYGLISILYGTVIGSILSKVLFDIMTSVVEFEWSIPWMHIIIASVGALVVTLLSGYIPLKRINNNILIENIRTEE